MDPPFDIAIRVNHCWSVGTMPHSIEKPSFCKAVFNGCGAIFTVQNFTVIQFFGNSPVFVVVKIFCQNLFPYSARKFKKIRPYALDWLARFVHSHNSEQLKLSFPRQSIASELRVQDLRFTCSQSIETICQNLMGIASRLFTFLAIKAGFTCKNEGGYGA